MDPVDEGELIEPAEMDVIFLGLFRHHVANMIAKLGHADITASLREIANADSEEEERQAAQRAIRLLEVDLTETSDRSARPPGAGNLIGGILTRDGPLAGIAVSRADGEALARLDLRPVFVGIHREVIGALIDDDLSLVDQALVLDKTGGPRPDRSDGAGGWIIALDEEAAS